MQEWYTEMQAMREEIEETQSEVLSNRIRHQKLLDVIEDFKVRLKKLEENK